MISMFQEETFKSMLYKTRESCIYMCLYQQAEIGIYDVIGDRKRIMGGLG